MERRRDIYSEKAKMINGQKKRKMCREKARVEQEHWRALNQATVL